MLDSKLGRVIMGLSVTTIFLLSLMMLVAIELSAPNLSPVSTAVACTPTQPPPTPTPCGCESVDCTKLRIQRANTNEICIAKQTSQTDGWKLTVESAYFAEDLDYIWVADPWYNQIHNTDELIWEITGSVNVTQLGEYSASINVSDKPLSYKCIHNRPISYWDDDNVSTNTMVYVVLFEKVSTYYTPTEASFSGSTQTITAHVHDGGPSCSITVKSAFYRVVTEMEGMGELQTAPSIDGTTYPYIDNNNTLWEEPVGCNNNPLEAGVSHATGPELPYNTSITYELIGQTAAWNGHSMPVNGTAADVGGAIHNGKIDWYQGIMGQNIYVPGTWDYVPVR
ncbi:hypothetical protein LLG95_03515 [bacterium]|nr:hypothetical protein [bacterium]